MLRSVLALLLLSTWAAAQTIDCGPKEGRALVLSGGGAKGAFEAGAVYHLIVHRHCDFKELSGVSVGALNAAFLAQAPSSSDPDQSLKNLTEQAEELIGIWDSIKGPQDIFKKRFLGMLRFGLFKIENVNDFTPLRNLIYGKVSPTRLLTGRTARVGVMSFWDGRYREAVSSRTSEAENSKFLDYIVASSLIPIYGRMPLIQDDPAITDKNQWEQFADAGIRRVTPVSSYFMTCNDDAVQFAAKPAGTSSGNIPCDRNGTKWMPTHEKPISQLFVVIASPYSRSSDEAPAPAADCCLSGTRRFTDGHKILDRTITLAVGIPYRWDLNFAQIANEFLGWREQEHAMRTRSPSNSRAEVHEDARRMNLDFPVESYNPGQSSDLPSLPYKIRLIVPQKVFADIYGFDPLNIREQLYCGCMAADQVMANGEVNRSMSDKCAQRFPMLSDPKGSRTSWESDVCRVGQAGSRKRDK